jgi:uncharacterized protein YcfJ
MRKTLSTAALAALIATPLLVGATDASASCQGRKDTGTALGAIGGALIGNSVSRGGGGAIVGGLGGAVVGHQIAKSGCGHARAYYRRTPSHYAYERRGAYAPAPSRTVYYDQRGNPVSTGSDYYRR